MLMLMLDVQFSEDAGTAVDAVGIGWMHCGPFNRGRCRCQDAEVGCLWRKTGVRDHGLNQK